MGRRKYDWERIDLVYITGDMSLKDLAAAEGIPLRSVEARARKIRYADKRAEYKRIVVKRAEQNMCRRDVNAISSLITATEKAASVLERHMDDGETIYEYAAGGKGSKLKKLDTKALRNMTGALRDAASALRILFPDQTENSANELQEVVIMPDRESEE